MFWLTPPRLQRVEVGEHASRVGPGLGRAEAPFALEATAHRVVRIARRRRGAVRRFVDAITAFLGSQVRFRRVLGIREDPLLAFHEYLAPIRSPAHVDKSGS